MRLCSESDYTGRGLTTNCAPSSQQKFKYPLTCFNLCGELRLDQEIRLNIMRVEHFLMLHCLLNTALYLVSEIYKKDWEQVLHGNRAALREMWRMAGIRGVAQWLSIY